MKLLGFAFTKIHADRKREFNVRSNIGINIDFLNINKENNELIKNESIYGVGFKFVVNYNALNAKKDDNQAQVLLEGILTISLDKNEDKDFSKTYKKKEMNIQLKEAIYNLLLVKCSPKAIDLEDQLNLPSHIPINRVKLQDVKK